MTETGRGPGHPINEPTLKTKFWSLYSPEWEKCDNGIPNQTKRARGALYGRMTSVYHALLGYNDQSFGTAIPHDPETGKWVPANPLAELAGLDAAERQTTVDNWKVIRKKTAAVGMLLNIATLH